MNIILINCALSKIIDLLYYKIICLKSEKNIKSLKYHTII